MLRNVSPAAAADATFQQLLHGFRHLCVTETEWKRAAPAILAPPFVASRGCARVPLVAQQFKIVPEHEATSRGQDQPDVAVLRNDDAKRIAILNAVSEHGSVACTEPRGVHFCGFCAPAG